MRSTFFEKKVEPKNFTYKGAVNRMLGFFCKQKNALTVASVLEQFRTQHM